MDRISKALEIASRRRGELADDRIGDDHADGPIAYSQTETVAVDDRILKRNRVLHPSVDAVTIDAYRLLRTRVLQRMRQNGWNTLGITSAMPREGKTVTAANLGISIAKGLTQTVMLVDADLRKPSVHQLFGLKPQRGLGDYLLSDAPIEKMLINPGIDRLVVLPGRPGASVSSEHLASPRMEALVVEVKRRYRDRIVIYDLPPVLVGDDVVSFAPQLDAVLMVTADGETGREQCNRACELLEGVSLLGTVLNKCDEVSHDYGDYY